MGEREEFATACKDGTAVYRDRFRWLCLGLTLALILAGFVGCDGLLLLLGPAPAPEEGEASPPLVQAGEHFDPEQSSSLIGTVTWKGALPVVAPYRAPISPHVQYVGKPYQDRFNPNVPLVDPPTRGVAHAVVFLRGVDPRQGKPWDHPPVRIEQRNHQIHVRQGKRDQRIGFVRRGDTVEMVAESEAFHVLRGRGAAFFSIPFPRSSQPCQRKLTRKGIVELTSAAGYFWMRGYLFVDDHPYYTLSDAQGRFQLEQVPAGRYQLVLWLPNWHEASRELDAETALINRLGFRPPLEVVRPVEVEPGEVREVSLAIDAEQFGPPGQDDRW
jgi:hypothetical protein